MLSRIDAAEQEALLRHDAELGAQRLARDVAQVVRRPRARGPRSGRRTARRAWRASTCRRRSRRRARRSGPAGRRGRRRAGPTRRRRPRRSRTRRPRRRSRRAARGSSMRVRACRPGRARLVEQLEDLVERRHARLIGGVELRELLDRVEEVVQRSRRRRRARRSYVAVDRLVAAVQQDHRPWPAADISSTAGKYAALR